MQDIFSTRSRAQFVETLSAFLDSMAVAFPECDTTRAWIEGMRTRAADPDRCCLDWREDAERPLPRGSAKWQKAVASIVDGSAVVYHAVAYRDAPALEKASTVLEGLGIAARVERLGEDDRTIFWEYLDELYLNAYRSARPRGRPPRVPTTDEIRSDIAARRQRRGAAPPETDAAVLTQGVSEAWQKLCTARGVAFTEDAARLHEVAARHTDAVALCKARDAAFAAEVLASFPDLGEEPFDETQWEALERAVALATMETSIPSNMMRGIEDVASRLAQDIADGKTDLASLDVEAIGKSVLAGVSSEEVAAFAQNVDRILPALGAVKPM